MDRLTYLANVKSRLTNIGCTIEDQVEIYGRPTDLLAQHSKFMLRRYSIIQTIVVIASFTEIDRNTVLHFSKACHEYAYCSLGFPWVQSSLLVPTRETLALPILIGDKIDADLVNTIGKSDPIHDPLLREISIPVLVDMKQDVIHYCTSKAALRLGLHKYGIKFIKANLDFGGFTE